MTSNLDVTLGPGQESAAAVATAKTRALPGERAGASIGEYKLLQQLGEGGFGVVWLAEQHEPVQRKVALKVIKLGMDTREVIARFEAERQALAMMDHPHIARVLDAGATDSGRPFFVMELVKGDPITDYCDRNNVSVEDRLALLVQVCQAVQHAHTKGIIHRDLKPSNVLVSTQDGKPHAKVIDFGIAKATASKLTERTLFTAQQQLIGTPEYMSPEQAEGSLDIDTRTDVYSLGVLLYELLTGSTPFRGDTLRTAAYAEIQRIIREEDPPKPSTRLSTLEQLPSVAAHRQVEPRRLSAMLRGELDWISMKALEKDRQRRYETASGLAADLQRYLCGEAVMAAPPGAGYRVRKFVRRNKHAVSAAALILLALILGVAGTGWGLVEARQQGREAQAARESAERRLAQLEQGTELLTGIFADLDLQRVKESGVTLEVELGDRLATAAERLDGEAVGDPLTVASLQEQMGISLHRLGHAAPSASVLEKSLETRRRLLGNEHPDTLESMHQLAVSYAGLGKSAEALALTEEVVKLRTDTLGAKHPDTLKSMNNLSSLYGRAGRREESLKLREEVLAHRRETLGKDHPDTLSSMQSLAGSYIADNRHADALALLEETRVLLRATLGADHPRTLLSMSTIASTYSMMGRHEDARKLYEETLSRQRIRLGPDHPSTMVTMHNLAGSYQDVGRDAESRRLYEETLALQRQKLGPDHPDTLATLGSLALSYSSGGESAKAAKLQEEGLSLQRRTLGPDHPDTLTSMINLATTYQDLGQHAAALKLNEETLAIMTASFGPNDPNTLVAKHNLADNYGTLGRHEEALRLREETAAAFLAELGPDHPYTLFSMASPASSYHEVGRLEDAMALREKALKALSAKFGPDDPETLKAMHNLGLSYAAMGRHEDALGLLQKALALRIERIGADHPDTLASVAAVARCLEKLDRSPEALPILDAAFLAVAGHEADPARVVPVLALRVISSHLRGDVAGVTDAVGRLAALLPSDYRSLFELACCTARLSAAVRAADPSPDGLKQSEEVANRAIDLLRQAIAAGYRNAPYLEQEPALDALRDREGFKVLRAQLVSASN